MPSEENVSGKTSAAAKARKPLARPPNLRIRLYIVATIALIPVYTIVVLGHMSDRRSTIDAAVRDAHVYGELLAQRLQADTEHVYSALSGLTSKGSALYDASTVCEAELAKVASSSSLSHGLLVADTSGTVVCEYGGPRRGSVAHRDYFRRVVEERGPTLGDFVDFQGTMHVLLALPRLEAGGEVSHVLISYVDASFLREPARDAPVHDDIDVLVVSKDGIPLAWHNNEGVYDSALLAQPGFAAAIASTTANTFYSELPGEIPHLYTAVPIRLRGSKEVVLVLGLHKEGLMRPAQYTFYRHLVTLGMVTLITYAGIWYANRRILYSSIEHIEEVQRLKSEFISFAAHQLRNPITTIGLYREILAAAAAKHKIDELQGPLAGLREGVQQLSNLVDELLEVHRIDEGRVRVEPVRTDIAERMRSVLERFEQQRKSKNLKLNKFGVEKPLYATLDPMLFEHSMANLLSNAIKYTEDRGTITVRVGPADKGIEASVTDTGRGIAAEHLPHLFEPYYKTKDKRKTRGQGSGFGLYLTRTFVELMGGSVHVSSVEGEGSRFTIYLPIHAESEKSGEGETPATNGSPDTESAPANSRGSRAQNGSEGEAQSNMAAMLLRRVMKPYTRNS